MWLNVTKEKPNELQTPLPIVEEREKEVWRRMVGKDDGGFCEIRARAELQCSDQYEQGEADGVGRVKGHMGEP